MAGYIYENSNGQFENVQVLSEGTWCQNCKFFEFDITIEDITASGACESCGCRPQDHVDSKVVSNGNSSGTT